MKTTSQKPVHFTVNAKPSKRRGTAQKAEAKEQVTVNEPATITINLTAPCAKFLRHLARKYGLPEESIVQAGIEYVLGHQYESGDADLEECLIDDATELAATGEIADHITDYWENTEREDRERLVERYMVKHGCDRMAAARALFPKPKPPVLKGGC